MQRASGLQQMKESLYTHSIAEKKIELSIKFKKGSERMNNAGFHTDEEHYATNMPHQGVSSTEILRANLERIQSDERAYYDRARDEQDIQSYYAEIHRNETDGKKLYRAMSELLTRTHDPEIRYSNSDEYLKTWVDLHSDGTLRSIYSGKEADPRTVLEEDAQQLVADETSISGHNVNIEHVVPQSWFGKVEPMKGDLHHLFYCDRECNSSRGNKVYKDFSDFQPDDVGADWVMDECGKGEGGTGDIDGVFEPEYAKGMVARAMLYFFLRYPNHIDTKYNRKIDIEVLLQWHKQDPPNLIYEKHRNQAIFTIQGNRNPLVDLPELADRIDFSLFQQLH